MLCLGCHVSKKFLSSPANTNEGPGLCALLITCFSYLIIIITFPVSLLFCVKVVQEYERAVIFRLGRLMKGGAKGPGIFFIIPCIDTYCKVDLRTVSFDVPPQEILSKDSVTVAVDAVVYYRISNATIAVSNVEDYGHSTRLLAATTLRNVLGTKNLSEILSERESISHVMQVSNQCQLLSCIRGEKDRPSVLGRLCKVEFEIFGSLTFKVHRLNSFSLVC
ncbi:mechanosensory protein 2 [Trichonephila clavipes]|nr:mechanosensory protein 2 [Trichonephila clavipes]